MRVLVVGASGILAPAAATLHARGDHVIGVARSGDGMPPGVEVALVDATVGPLPTGWDAALVYAPAVSAPTLDLLRAAGRVVLVRGSRYADPALGELVVPPDTLQLGWHVAADGDVRWHTPTEVSVAAMEVLDSGDGAVLGSVRPWDHRP